MQRNQKLETIVMLMMEKHQNNGFIFVSDLF